MKKVLLACIVILLIVVTVYSFVDMQGDKNKELTISCSEYIGAYNNIITTHTTNSKEKTRALNALVLDMERSLKNKINSDKTCLFLQLSAELSDVYERKKVMTLIDKLIAKIQETGGLDESIKQAFNIDSLKLLRDQIEKKSTFDKPKLTQPRDAGVGQ